MNPVDLNIVRKWSFVAGWYITGWKMSFAKRSNIATSNPEGNSYVK